jgi:hypothetical protein
MTRSQEIEMTDLEALQAARKKIEKSENWCKKRLAEDPFGNSVSPCSPDACKWCTVGALRAIHESAGNCFTPNLLGWEVLLSVAGTPSLVAFNDSEETTHTEVLAIFDKAIAELQRKTA